MNKTILVVVLLTLIGCIPDRILPRSTAIVTASNPIFVPVNTGAITNVTINNRALLNNVSIQFYPVDNKAKTISYWIYVQKVLQAQGVAANNTLVDKHVNFPETELINITIEVQDQNNNKKAYSAILRLLYDFDAPIMDAIVIVFN